MVTKATRDEAHFKSIREQNYAVKARTGTFVIHKRIRRGSRKKQNQNFQIAIRAFSIKVVLAFLQLISWSCVSGGVDTSAAVFAQHINQVS